MVLVGTAIFPHGALAFDGDPDSLSQGCRDRNAVLPKVMKESFKTLYEGCCEASEAIASWEPDLIILHSPHGITLQKATGIYVCERAEGTAEWKDCWKEFKVALDSDKEMSKHLLTHLDKGGVRVEGITCFWDYNPLRWAEVIPLWYIFRKMKTQPRVVIMTSSAHIASLASMEDELLALGTHLAHFVASQSKLRVALVVSGDLSHMHATSCTVPLYLPDPRSLLVTEPHASASLMDRAFHGWAKGLEDFSLLNKPHVLPGCSSVWRADHALPWLQKAASLDQQAYACGLAGFIMLHAFMQTMSQENQLQFKPSCFTYEAPTYFGMMTTVFSVV